MNSYKPTRGYGAAFIRRRTHNPMGQKFTHQQRGDIGAEDSLRRLHHFLFYR